MSDNNSVSDSQTNAHGDVRHKVQVVRVQEAQHGQRIDNFLMRHLKGVPRSRVYRLIRRGEVRLNRKRCTPDRKLETGDQIRIPPFSGPGESPRKKPGPGLAQLLLDSVLHEDDQLLVLNKPAGMAVHGGSGIRLGLIETLRQLKPEWRQLELTHRLDRDTSGCLVIAKNSRVLKHIQAEFKARHITKCYLALVHGSWPEAGDRIDAPLRRNALSSGERMVRVAADGKPSRTWFRVVRRFRNATLVEARPQTGRTHQIRVHCQHGGHPIVGDPKYTTRHAAADLAKVRHLCLHAASIEFTPAPEKPSLRIEAPLDKTLRALMERLV